MRKRVICICVNYVSIPTNLAPHIGRTIKIINATLQRMPLKIKLKMTMRRRNSNSRGSNNRNSNRY